MKKKVVALSIAAMISSGAFAQSVNDGTNPVQVSPDGGTTLLDAGPNLTVPGNLDVTGNTSLSTLSSSGLATLDSAAVTNAATVGGTLDVTGVTTLNGALVANGGATINNGATVNGDLALNGAITNADDVNIVVDANSGGVGGFRVTDLNGGASTQTMYMDAQGTYITTDGIGSLTVANTGVTANGLLTANNGATVNGNLTMNGDVVNDNDLVVRVDNDNGGYGNFIVVDQNGGAPVDTLISNAQSTSIGTDGVGSLTVANTGVTATGPLTVNDGAGSLTVGNIQTSLGVTNAGGSLNGITSTATQTTVTGGTASTTLTLDDSGMAVTDSGFGQTFQVSNSGAVQVGGIGSAGPSGTVSVSNGISNTIVLEGSTGNVNVAGNITAAAGTITGATVNAGNVNVSGAVTAGSVSTGTLNAATGNITNLTSTTATIGIIGAGTIVNAGSLTTGTLSTVGNAAIGGDLAVTGTTTMADMLTANGGINSGTVNINNVASGANNITNVNTLGARQGNFGNTSGTAGVVNVRNGAVDSITLDGASGQVSAASVEASGLVSAGALQVHTNGGVDVAGAGGLDVSAGGANIGVRNASNTAWNGLSVTDSSASLRGGTASTTLTLDNAGMTVADTTNGQTLAVSNTGALRVGGNGTVGNKQAGTVNVTNTAGTSTITLNGATGAITATSVTANAYNVANVVASDSVTAPNAYLGGAGAEVDVAAGTAVTFNGNRLQGVGAATAGTDAVNLNQLNGVRNNLQNQISDNRTEARRGVAGASAIAGIPALESGKQYNFGVGLGHYKGESALALGGNARFDANTVGRLAVGFSGSDATVSAGVGWSF